MVQTRSGNVSPAVAGASEMEVAPTQAPAPDDPVPRGDVTAAAAVVVVDPKPAAGAAAAPVTMTTDQLLLLINRLSRSESVSTPTPSFSGNFAKCTARFDGGKSSDVLAFIDAIETYKECVRVEDNNALRGLSMLLTGLAATWWQGVKDSIVTWQAAVESLKQTFGPRLPPPKLYRKIFEREQRVDEATDLFVCHVRALFSQLPPCSLTEVVQLDMTYGLLHRRIREKVPRSSFVSFAQLLTEARRVEEILEESRPKVTAESKPSTSSAPTIRPPTPPGSNKFRPHCNYCKQYGHLKEACQRLAKQKTTIEAEESKATTFTCFGCGAPGVIRSNCTTCREKKPVVSSVFQSVSASDDKVDSRVRPVISVEIYSEVGRVLLDTGAKHCIGSVSLRSHLAKNGHMFENVVIELKYADGRVCSQNVELANVNVTLRGVTLPVSFIMLPKATESLLGMNFIHDVGMVLDFDRGIWFMRGDKSPQPICFESKPVDSLACSSVGLRRDEGSHPISDERDRPSNLLNIPQDIFVRGGGPIQSAAHRIDTDDAAPIASPPYKVSPVLPAKVQALMNMKPPANLKELKTFLQTCSLFRKFIPQFSKVTRPLTDLTKKDRRWHWGESEQNAFQELKVRLSSSSTFRQANQRRRNVSPYREGVLVPVESPTARNAANGITHKFAPRWQSPYRISQVVSPSRYVVVDNEGQVKGKYHASALTPYSGVAPAFVHPRRRGRLAKSQPGRSCDLEGEDIASYHHPSVTPRRNPPVPTCRRSARLRVPTYVSIY